MLDPADLYEIAPALPDLGAPVMVVALDGFVDAGAARRLAVAHLLAASEATTVATFDVDQLHDYRARRPPMLFVEDHWETYDTPSLTVQALRDARALRTCCSTAPSRTCSGSGSPRRSASSSTRSACA